MDGFHDKGQWKVNIKPFGNIEDDGFAALAALFYYNDKTKVGQIILNTLLKNYPDASKNFSSQTDTIIYNKKTCLSGINIDGNIIRMGSVSAVHSYFLALGHVFPDECIIKEKDQNNKVDVFSLNGKIIGFIELT